MRPFVIIRFERGADPSKGIPATVSFERPWYHVPRVDDEVTLVNDEGEDESGFVTKVIWREDVVIVRYG